MIAECTVLYVALAAVLVFLMFCSSILDRMASRKLIIVDIILAVLGIILLVVGLALFPVFDKKIKESIEKVDIIHSFIQICSVEYVAIALE